MKIHNKRNFQLAISQTIAQKIYFAVEGSRGRWYAALEKAAMELRHNNTVEFDGRVLTFISSNSLERRYVTKDGCFETCKCGNAISYHHAMFSILENYERLMAEINKDLNLQKGEPVCKSCSSRRANDTGLCFICEQNQSPYLKQSSNGKREKIGGVFV